MSKSLDPDIRATIRDVLALSDLLRRIGVRDEAQVWEQSPPGPEGFLLRLAALLASSDS
jgi:hypothetical protein